MVGLTLKVLLYYLIGIARYRCSVIMRCANLLIIQIIIGAGVLFYG